MAREVVHIYLQHPKIAGREMLSIYIPALLIVTLFLIGVDAVAHTISLIDLLIIILAGWLFGGCVMGAQYLMLLYRGENFSEELIIYDNGWFVVWGPTYSDGWVAPAKLDWILPDKITMRSWGVIQYIFIPNEKVSRKYRLLLYKVPKCKLTTALGISWIYPRNTQYREYLFYGTIYGCVSSKQYKDLKKLAKYLDAIGRKNLELGRVWIPSGKPQASSLYMKQPFYWNDVFKKERLREYYMEDTGEDMPEPIRSYLYDFESYRKKYLKLKKETGDWVGRKGKGEWYIDWEWLERWLGES